eukprot:507742-Pelagomonas_calceolata.AAC.13
MSAPAWQSWCKIGNQASAVFGHNLSMRTCSAYILGMPCQVWGPRYGGCGSWRAVTSSDTWAFDQNTGSGQLHFQTTISLPKLGGVLFFCLRPLAPPNYAPG